MSRGEAWSADVALSKKTLTQTAWCRARTFEPGALAEAIDRVATEAGVMLSEATIRLRRELGGGLSDSEIVEWPALRPVTAIADPPASLTVVFGYRQALGVIRVEGTAGDRIFVSASGSTRACVQTAVASLLRALALERLPGDDG